MKYAAILFTIGVLGMLAGALVLVATYGDEEEESPGATATPSAAPTRSPSPSPRPTATPDPLAEVCAENPDPATDDVNEVDAPIPRATVSSPVTVSGRIEAFEAAFRITIFDADGSQIAEQFGLSEEGQTLAAFSEAVVFSVSKPTTACIWVYESSARDGEPIHVVQVPVTLEP